MSIRIMSQVWEIRFPTQSQLLIALKLADFANDEGGSIYPSRSRLADEAQCSETTVKVALRGFRSIGLLKVTQEGGKGPRDTTHYAWDLRLLKALADGKCTISGGGEELEIKWADKGAEFDPFDGPRGQNSAEGGGEPCAKGATGRPQYTKNHQIEPSTRGGALATQSAARPAQTTITVSEHPDEWAAWKAWTQHTRAHQPPGSESYRLAMFLHRGLHEFRSCMVPSRMPPDTPQIRNPAGRDA